MEEISEADARRVLIYESLIYEKKTGIVIGFSAIKSAVTLAKKYLAGQFLPSSAQDLLKSSLSIAEREGKKYLGRDEVVKAVRFCLVSSTQHIATSDFHSISQYAHSMRRQFYFVYLKI